MQKSKTDPDSFSPKLADNESKIKQQLGNPTDMTFRHFNIRVEGNRTVDCLLVFINDLIDERIIDQSILAPLSAGFPDEHELTSEAVKQKIHGKNISETTQIKQAIRSLLRGFSLLLMNGSTTGFLIDTKKLLHRAIEEPPAELVVKGPRDGFIEDISVNISLLRQRLPHPDLHYEEVLIGKYSQTKTYIAYIRDIAQQELVEKIKSRLSAIEIDIAPLSGEIEQFIEDRPSTIFPTIGNTQRPDKTAALLAEGRIAIFVDNTPVVLYAPYLFFGAIQSTEDYSARPFYSSFIRFLRFMGLLFSVLAPSFYVASLNFQKAMIPTSFISPLINAREKVPVPLVMEVALMILIFEIIREAGARMPKSVNQSLSIVGALILGEVSVTAGLVGAPTIVVVSISMIFAFVITPIAEVITLLRILLLIPTTLFGVYGMVIGALIVLTHMASLTSMGVPYMSPLAPTYFADWKDFFIRAPLQWFTNRPRSIPSKHKRRLGNYPRKW